jgi:hypothetical protein
MTYVMDIEDLFRLGDGRTVFTGVASTAAPNVPMRCVITVDGEPTEHLTIQSVEMPLLTVEAVQAGRRIETYPVGTYDAVRLTRSVVESRRCQLREQSEVR